MQCCERTLSWIFNKLFGLLFNIKLSSSVALVQMVYFFSVSFSFNILLVYLSCTHGLFICCLLSSVPKLKCLLCFFSSALYNLWSTSGSLVQNCMPLIVLFLGQNALNLFVGYLYWYLYFSYVLDILFVLFVCIHVMVFNNF